MAKQDSDEVQRNQTRRLHHRVNEARLGEQKTGQLLSTKEFDYVKQYLKNHPDFSGTIRRNSKKNPDSPLRYSVRVVQEDGKPRAFAIYREDEKFYLGKGAFGTVKLAQEIDSKEWVAVKSLVSSEEVKDEIIREKQTLKDIGDLIAQATRIKKTSNTETQKEDLYIPLAYGVELNEALFKEDDYKVSDYDVFELLEKLDDRKKRLLNLTEVALEVLGAVNALHQKGYINRDIKDRNIMLDPVMKKAQLIDQGYTISFEEAEKIREILQKPADERTVEEVKQIETFKVGTPPYMAPEVWNDQGPSKETDYYATGVLLAKATDYENRHYDNDDLEESIEFIRETGEDQKLKELYSEIYSPDPDFMFPEFEIFLTQIHGLTETDPEKRLTTLQAQSNLIELKRELLKGLNYGDNIIFFELKLKLDDLYQKFGKNPKKNEQLVLMEKLIDEVNMLSSTRPITKQMLSHLGDLLVRAEELRIESTVFKNAHPIFSECTSLMRVAFSKALDLIPASEPAPARKSENRAPGVHMQYKKVIQELKAKQEKTKEQTEEQKSTPDPHTRPRR